MCIYRDSIRESHRARAIVSTTGTTRSYRSRVATAQRAPPSPESAMYWCNSNASASAVPETRVSSYLSVAGEAVPRGWQGGHKDPKRVVPPAGDTTAAVEEGGARVCRMPKLPLKHDARTPPSQTVRLQLTLPPIPVPGCLTPLIPSPSGRARGLSVLSPRLARLIEIPMQNVRTLELVR